LGIHALSVFAFGGGPFGREWEERKTSELMDRDEIGSFPERIGEAAT
jgi:hypothetical protein